MSIVLIEEKKIYPLLQVCVHTEAEEAESSSRPNPETSQCPSADSLLVHNSIWEYWLVSVTRLLNIFHITPHEIYSWSVPSCPVLLEELSELQVPLLQKR